MIPAREPKNIEDKKAEKEENCNLSVDFKNTDI